MTLNQILFVGLLTAVSLVALAIGPYLVERGPAWLGMLRDRYVQPRAVSSVSRADADTQAARIRADYQTDRQTDRQTAADPRQTADNEAVAALQIDRTRKAVIAVLVDSGWKVSEIRAVLKGDNTAISAEIAEATNSLAAGQPLARTPIAQRPVDGRKFERPALAAEE